jgi:uncharacterized protein YndB with AHSA1/START domain
MMTGSQQIVDGRPALRFERLLNHPRERVFNPRLGPDWQHAAGWETYLSRLDVHLAGGFLSEEEAHEKIDELFERYRETFGSSRV